MPQIDEKHVRINGCILVWDGITRPEQNDGGNMRWNAKVVVDPNNPDLQVLNQLASQELQTSEFKGTLPNGGIMPIGTAGPNEFNGLFNGYAVINASTFKQPKVHAEVGGALLDPMQYSQKLFDGQVIDILVHCAAYNNKSKGIAARLDGLCIVESAGAQSLGLGGGGYDTSKVFGGSGQAPAQGGQAQGSQAQGGFGQQQGGQAQGGFGQQQGGQQQGGFGQQQGGQQQGGQQQNGQAQGGFGQQQNGFNQPQ